MGLGQQESDGQLEAAPQDPDRFEGVESKEEAVTREQLEAASPHLVLDCVDLAGHGGLGSLDLQEYPRQRKNLVLLTQQKGLEWSVTELENKQ